MSQRLYYLDNPRAADSSGDVRPLLRAFAASPIFRSATVDELILDDPYRRPLRPEDLAFIDLSTPLDRASMSSLSALATQRMLLSIYEVRGTRQRKDRAKEAESFCEFYSDRNRVLGEMARPWLENHAFADLASCGLAGRDNHDFLKLAFEIRDERVAVEAALALLASRAGHAAENARLREVQFFGLAATRWEAAQAIVEGWRAPAPDVARAAAAIVHFRPAAPGDPFARQHAYWQFYLPGSLAAANVLHYLALQPGYALASLGAIAFLALQYDAFLASVPRGSVEVPVDAWQRGLEGLVEALTPEELSVVATGLRICAEAQRRADDELRQQLEWINKIEVYGRLAQDIVGKIERERITIDRETFVEPKEMCSTTHVHDDHRLVVIESGEMVFWAAPGMRLCLSPGEMILIPRQRLHGSSVLSEVCVYHQPIIPEDWLALHLAAA